MFKEFIFIDLLPFKLHNPVDKFQLRLTLALEAWFLIFIAGVEEKRVDSFGVQETEWFVIKQRMSE